MSERLFSRFVPETGTNPHVKTIMFIETKEAPADNLTTGASFGMGSTMCSISRFLPRKESHHQGRFRRYSRHQRNPARYRPHSSLRLPGRFQ